MNKPWKGYFECKKRTYLNGEVRYVIFDLTEDMEIGEYPDPKTAEERLKSAWVVYARSHFRDENYEF